MTTNDPDRSRPPPVPPPADGAGLSRRSLLTRGLLGGGVLLLGGGGFLALRSSAVEPAPKDPLQVLDAGEYAVVMAVARRIIAPAPGMPTVEQVNVGPNVDAILGRADAGVRKELRQLLGLFENALPTLLFTGHPTPFSRLPPEQQDAVLRDWRDSRLVLRRTGYTALRTIVLAAYYASPLTWDAVGYPGPPQGFHDPKAPLWRGAGAPRPEGNGVFHEEEKP